MKNISLVGYTGFVGSNLNSEGNFNSVFNSKNILDSYGTKPDLLFYAGVKAEKFLANKNPEYDNDLIDEAIDNIKKINPKKIVLISTIDVYKNPFNVNEKTEIDFKGLHPYGLNRYKLEKWTEENFNDYLIVRLPGLYGKNIKKNFIYDLIKIIPSALNKDKFNELKMKDDLIEKYYKLSDNGFYKLIDISDEENKILKNYFNSIGFNALNFTDSRGLYQFYNLKYLWNHINIALNEKINKINIATEPITISELYKSITGNDFKNEISQIIPQYNFKTLYSEIYNGKNGYIFNKDFIKKDIKDFVSNINIL